MRGAAIASVATAISLAAALPAAAQTGAAAAGNVAGPAGGVGIVGAPPAAGAQPSTDVLAPATSGRVPLGALGSTGGEATPPTASPRGDDTPLDREPLPGAR